MPEEMRFEPMLEGSRKTTIDVLCEHFAVDRLTVDEFERRLDAAHRASSRQELDALLADLPKGGTQLAAPNGETRSVARPQEVAHPDFVKDRETVIAIMGGTGRKGRWSPARQNLVVAVMGGAELDFREAVLPPGVTEVQVYALWGGVEIVVPPDVHVESHGFAVLGGFDHAAEGGASPEPGVPTLRVTGVAVMGGVDVTVRQPGESARDARRRRRLEARDRRRLSDGR